MSDNQIRWDSKRLSTKIPNNGINGTYQKGTENVERYEVGKCYVRSATGWIVIFVAVWIALYFGRLGRTVHHDLLPRFTWRKNRSIRRTLLRVNACKSEVTECRTRRRSEQNEDSLRERLKVVVTVYGRIVVYRDLSENLGKNDNVKRDKFVEEREGFEYFTCMPITAQMKKSIMIRRATQGRAWKDLIKVQRSVLMPSPLLNSLTRRITRNSRKKLIEMMVEPG